MTTSHQSPIHHETSDVRLLRWYGLGAATPAAVWAGLRRATITVALLVITAGFVVGAVAAEALNAVLYGAALGWAAYVAVITVPGTIRVMRSRS